MFKQFYIQKCRCVGYGSRVFLHASFLREMLRGTSCFLDQLPRNSDHPVAKVLRKHCVWGGADKEFSGWWGYELPTNPEKEAVAFFDIRKVLTEQGFEELTEAPWAGRKIL